MEKNKQQIKINFNNGITSTIDENVYKLILKLENEIKNPIKLPYFWNLSRSIKKIDENFLNFYSFLLANAKLSKSQLYQDLFVLFTFEEKKNGTFLEYGATDGISLSNTFLLENQFKWRGLLAEPSKKWHSSLKNNRPNSKIIEECIYAETGRYLDFFTSDAGELSTLEEFRQSDISSMPGNTNLRNKSGYNHKVLTISLNDVFKKYFDNSPIDYMSVDTEGSELLILQNFDFEKFSPRIVTVEHNYTDNQKKLDRLFIENNYTRIFKEYTQFDAWYVLNNK